jgi:acyl-CoA synthetase (AMP-forming)/AMP-acid ligase II/thioesterase domain-containing protein/aryl carrier-like protein
MNPTPNPQNFIKETFQNSVQSFPDRLALFDSTIELTFKELESKTAQIAASINDLRAESEYWGYVPISTTRDVDSALLVLACVLHDIPFAPLDPEWGQERLGFVSEALGQPGFFLSSQANYQNLTQVLGRTINVHTLSSLSDLEDRAQSPQMPPVVSELGFVIFTSGTTGFPKGVEFDSGGLGRRLSQRTNKKGHIGQMRPEETLATLAQPINFAAGLFRLCDVLFGCSIRIISLEEMSVDVFVPMVKKLKVNRLSGSPALMILLSDFKPKGLSKPYLPEVREVTWGGDSISYSTVSRLKDYFLPETKMSSGFGATEAASSLGNSFLIKDAPSSGPMPVGKWDESNAGLFAPFEEMDSHYVLMSKDALAKGYLNDPELTKKRFLHDEQGQRRWYSGDVVRVDENGLIWPAGRVDDLVKIRGKLTSPSEATRALLQLDGVIDALVLAVPGKRQDKKLVAHLALSSDSKLTFSQIKQSISKTLPAHLIPREFFLHPFIPKTPRGKPDRNRLMQMPNQLLKVEDIELPKTKSEEVLLEALKTVLDVESISVTQNLWESGLDSLAALQLEAIVRDYSSSISLDLISQHETIRSLANALDLQDGNLANTEVVMNKDGTLPPVFAFPGAGNKAAHFTHFARELGRDQPVISLLFGKGDVSEQNTTVSGRVQAALERIDSFSLSHVTIVGYSLGGTLAYEVAKACAKKQIKVSLIIFDTSLSLMEEVSSTPLARVRLANAKTSSGKLGPAKLLKLVLEGFRRHGTSKALKITLLEKPFELLLANPAARGTLRRIFGLWQPSRISKVRLKLTETLIHNAVADFKAEPLSEDEANFLDLVYVHTLINTQLDKWKEFAPNARFISTEGGHMSMLNPPHIASLVRQIRQALGSRLPQ